MNGYPRSVSITLSLILLNILIWFSFAIIVAANLHPALPTSPLFKGIMTFLAFTIAIILLILLIFLTKHNRVAYFLTVGIFVITSVVTIFDDFGWVDFIVLVIGLAPIILLAKDRAWYLMENPGFEKTQKPSTD
jgi:hypothetical protein